MKNKLSAGQTVGIELEATDIIEIQSQGSLQTRYGTSADVFFLQDYSKQHIVVFI